MKKFTLNVLALAAIVGIVPSSIYPVEVTKDGVTITASYKGTFENRNLILGLIQIKNDTNETIEIPKYAVLSPFMANEKILKEAMGIIKIDILKLFCFGVVSHTLFLHIAGLVISDLVWLLSPDLSRIEKETFEMGAHASPLTGVIFAAISYYDQIWIQKGLQEYLDRKVITLKQGESVNFIVYVDLDKYQKSADKKVTIKLHKKDSNQVILCEVDTTSLQTQIA